MRGPPWEAKANATPTAGPHRLQKPKDIPPPPPKRITRQGSSQPEPLSQKPIRPTPEPTSDTSPVTSSDESETGSDSEIVSPPLQAQSELKIPPIIIKVESWPAITSTILTAYQENSFTAKYTKQRHARTNIRYQHFTIHTKKTLTTKNFPFHTFSLPEERTLKVVIKGLPPVFPKWLSSSNWNNSVSSHLRVPIRKKRNYTSHLYDNTPMRPEYQTNFRTQLPASLRRYHRTVQDLRTCTMLPVPRLRPLLKKLRVIASLLETDDGQQS